MLSDLELSLLVFEPGLLGSGKWFGNFFSKTYFAQFCFSPGTIILLRTGILYRLKGCGFGFFRHGGMSSANTFCVIDRSGQKIHHVEAIQLTLIEHNWN